MAVPERPVSFSHLAGKATALQSQKHTVCILNLPCLCSVADLTLTKAVWKGLMAGMKMLIRIDTLTSRLVCNCTPPTSAPRPMHPAPAVCVKALQWTVRESQVRSRGIGRTDHKAASNCFYVTYPFLYHCSLQFPISTAWSTPAVPVLAVWTCFDKLHTWIQWGCAVRCLFRLPWGDWANSAWVQQGEERPWRQAAVAMVCCWWCTTSEHDRKLWVLAGDREVFSREDRICPALVAVYTLETKKQEGVRSSQLCHQHASKHYQLWCLCGSLTAARYWGCCCQCCWQSCLYFPEATINQPTTAKVPQGWSGDSHQVAALTIYQSLMSQTIRAPSSVGPTLIYDCKCHDSADTEQQLSAPNAKW